MQLLYILGWFAYDHWKINQITNLTEQYNKAVQLINQGDLNTAKSLLEECIQADPENGQYDFSLGNIYRKQGDLEKALDCYENTIKKSPYIKEAYNNIAAIKMMQEKFDEAQVIVESGLEVSPDFAELQFKKGQIHFVNEEYRQTIDSMQDLAVHEKYFEAYRFMGISYLRMNDPKKALKNFNTYLDKAPDDVAGKKDIEKIVKALKK